MSVEDKIEARIEAAFSDKETEPHPNGDDTEEVDIRGEGLSLNEVQRHQLVSDVHNNDDGSYHVYVHARYRVSILRSN